MTQTEKSLRGYRQTGRTMSEAIADLELVATECLARATEMRGLQEDGWKAAVPQMLRTARRHERMSREARAIQTEQGLRTTTACRMESDPWKAGELAIWMMH